MSTCTIANLTKGMQILNLPHGIVPECATMGVTGTRDYLPATGERPVRAHKRPISGSVTLLAKGDPGGGDKVSGLPRSVRHAPDVKAALAATPPRIAILDDSPKEPTATERAPETSAVPEAAEKPANVDTPRAPRGAKKE